MSQLVNYAATINIAAGQNFVNHQTGGMPYTWRFEDSSGNALNFEVKPDYANALPLSRLSLQSTDAYANVKVYILAVRSTTQDLLPIL